MQPSNAAPDPFARALATYREAGDASKLREWVNSHAEDPRAELWREILAMRMYEGLVFGPVEQATRPDEGEDPALEPLPEPDEAELRSLLATYPGTLGARNARAHLSAAALQSLRSPTLNPRVVEFLGGDDRHCGPGDPGEFRLEYEPGLRRRVGSEVLALGCDKAMGYCNWWVEAFPDDREFTPRILGEQRDAWFKRARPRWRSRSFATCARRCAKSCRAAAAPFDDSCYGPCMSKCDAREE